MKIVINKCYGGFGVTEAVYTELGIKWDGYGYLDNEALGVPDEFVNNNRFAYRADPRLVAAVEKVGLEEASDSLAELIVVEIPDDAGWNWTIEEYDGVEWIAENHRTWRW